jgi:large subunit ribosomal protein L14
MIGMRTILDVADNSGARRLACILPRGGDLGLRAGLGDVVTASVKEAAPDSAIKKGKVVRCVIVRMRKETRRKDGTYIRFDSNAAVLVNEVNEPVARFRTGGARAARQKIHEDRFARAGGHLMPGRRKSLAEPVRIRLKKNDVVKVITGRDKGKQGRVIEIDRRTGKIVVEHVMMMKRHTKPNPSKQIKGGIAERESPIHVSNVKKLEKE